jgi:hypothetical protein
MSSTSASSAAYIPRNHPRKPTITPFSLYMLKNHSLSSTLQHVLQNHRISSTDILFYRFRLDMFLLKREGTTIQDLDDPPKLDDSAFGFELGRSTNSSTTTTTTTTRTERDSLRTFSSATSSFSTSSYSIHGIYSRSKKE